MDQITDEQRIDWLQANRAMVQKIGHWAVTATLRGQDESTTWTTWKADTLREAIDKGIAGLAKSNTPPEAA